MLLACGVPPPCLHSCILRELREQDLARIIKSIGVATSALVQLCISQVHPALEMLVQRLSHLHGLSKWPYHFAALGLQPSRVATALEAAVSLRASAELLLLSARRANPELACFASWLIRVYRKLRDEPPPSAEEMHPLNSKVRTQPPLNPRPPPKMAHAELSERAMERPTEPPLGPLLIAPRPKSLAR